MRKLIALMALTITYTSAAAISYTGNLNPNDPNDVALFTFTLSSTGSVSIQSWGYGGGANASGTVIATGGFDPYVSLFSGVGNRATFLASNDDGLCPPGNGSVACHDSTLGVTTLAAGSYTVALTVFNNFSFAENTGSGTLGDGFIALGNYFDASEPTRSVWSRRASIRSIGTTRCAFSWRNVRASPPMVSPALRLICVLQAPRRWRRKSLAD